MRLREDLKPQRDFRVTMPGFSLQIASVKHGKCMITIKDLSFLEPTLFN